MDSGRTKLQGCHCSPDHASSPQPIDDPSPGIRAVLIAGAATGNVCGLLYLFFAGYLLICIQLNPLGLIGAMMTVGLIGYFLGTVSGFSMRLILEKTSISSSWLMPVLLSGLASGAFGLWIAYIAAALLKPRG